MTSLSFERGAGNARRKPTHRHYDGTPIGFDQLYHRSYVNDAGGHVREVIETLSDLDFTEEELIEVFHFSETDVKVCLAYADKDKEVE